MNDKPETISVELADSQAYALAQFFKRVTFDDFRKRALNDDDASEMLNAAMLVREALVKAGYEPR
jgi:hypothetical protein